MGINWVGIVFGLGAVISMGYWTTDFLVVQRVISAKDLRSAKLAPLIGAAFKMCVPFIVILPGLLGLAVLDSPGHHFLVAGNVAARARKGQAHSYDEVLPLMLARYCGPGLLGLGITALIAGFMSGMAGNVSAFATVWTYDIYRAMIRKDASDEHYVTMGRWCTIVGVLVSIGTAYLVMQFQQHHGLRAGTVQLLHRAAVRHRAARHALEARHPAGGFWGLLAGTGSAIGMWAWVKIDPAALSIRRACPRRQRHGGEYVPRLWSWLICVLVTVVVSLCHQAEAGRRNWSAWFMAAPRFRRKAICRYGSGRSSGPA